VRTVTGSLRWRLAADEESPPALFDPNSDIERRVGVGEYRGLTFYEVNAKRIVNKVPDGSPVPFRYTINAYRGCSHACRYCFARPTHDYLGFNIAEDFDTRIVVKVNAVARARAELASRRWRGDLIAMGTNTDPYQKAEARYHLTRGLIQVLAEARNPFSILTKSTLVLRDLDVLRGAAERTEVGLNISIGTLDTDVWRLLEPGTPPPSGRLEAVRRLNAAGIPCGVLIAPVVPGLSDDEEHLVAIARACKEAGATSAHPIALHLRPKVREHYLNFLAQRRPDLLSLYRDRFGRGSYQSAEIQRRIEETVKRAFGEVPPTEFRRVPARTTPRPEIPPAQLRFFSGTISLPRKTTGPPAEPNAVDGRASPQQEASLPSHPASAARTPSSRSPDRAV
jgi:DNA repair photolyase